MSTENESKTSTHGGARAGAGRPKGVTKLKICVSVDAELWEAAVTRWDGMSSHLVDFLIRQYVGEKHHECSEN